jgi:hypothetical protein
MRRNVDVNSQIEPGCHLSGPGDAIAPKIKINERTPEVIENTATIFGARHFCLKTGRTLEK